jgi:hypothetical protein
MSITMSTTTYVLDICIYRHSDTYIHNTYIHTYIHAYIYIYIGLLTSSLSLGRGFPGRGVGCICDTTGGRPARAPTLWMCTSIYVYMYIYVFRMIARIMYHQAQTDAVSDWLGAEEMSWCAHRISAIESPLRFKKNVSRRVNKCPHGELGFELT